MRITTLTFIAFYLNGAIDTGRYDDLTVAEAKTEIGNGTIFDFLRQRLGNDIDLSILTKEDEAELLSEWQDLLAAVNERRKMGIEMRGLPLLIAYLLEGIQRRLPR
ncbi:hypothetical protein [Hoeflea sp. 108]|uniref:hypothetical protein n=1 Tax=Hoeflea sp. 108 TaxID=1116369 RepID=UPI0003632ADA|nr:hypothetical protein [Hoeflea sp. 108]